MKKILLLSLVLFGSLSFAQNKTREGIPEIKSTEVNLSCTGSTGFEEVTRTIQILFIENNYKIPAAINDGFRNQVYSGLVTSNYFTWDRGINNARLDRYTGTLVFYPKDNSEGITLSCRKVQKQF